ncbi:MAG: hypothetical protein RIT02_3125 [Planctomycetota bacterium]|jgi:hypothetical protein
MNQHFPLPASSWRPSRRAVLQAGLFSSAAAGQVVQAATGGGGGAVGFGSATRCLLLFMWGGPSQLDTFDLKPQAPREVRGDFAAIDTAVPGMQICEHFRRLAPLTDLVTLIRSMTHDDPAHLSSAHTTLTGQLPPVNKSDDEPPSRSDSPHLGSLAAQFLKSSGGLPSAVSMPWHTLHPAAPGGTAPGQTGGWLGPAADPLLITGNPAAPGWSVPVFQLADGVSVTRLDQRRALLRSLDAVRLELESPVDRMLSDQQSAAFNLLSSSALHAAFDLQSESPATRERYGMNIHGQCVLLARRLLERGVPFVSVNWHNDGQNFWDTHGDNFRRLRDSLIPPADQALAAVLQDLRDSGLLEDTLVVWTGEFGRRPQITAANAGREHHPWCYSSLLAGAGVRRGSIYGASDQIAAFPRENPVSPRDLGASVMHALGVPSEAALNDITGRPHLLYGGRPVSGLFSGG